MNRDVLIANKWEPMIGYCFPTPPAHEHELTFVEKEKAEKVFAEGPKEYFWHPSREALFELNEAWEYFLEDYYDEHNTEYSDNKHYPNVGGNND